MADFKRRPSEPSWARTVGEAISGLVGAAVVAARYVQIESPRMRRQAKSALTEIRSWPDRANQALLDSLSADLGRKITNEDLDTSEKRDRIAKELAFDDSYPETEEYKKLRDTWNQRKSCPPSTQAKVSSKKSAPSTFTYVDDDDVPF